MNSCLSRLREIVSVLVVVMASTVVLSACFAKDPTAPPAIRMLDCGGVYSLGAGGAVGAPSAPLADCGGGCYETAVAPTTASKLSRKGPGNTVSAPSVRPLFDCGGLLSGACSGVPDSICARLANLAGELLSSQNSLCRQAGEALQYRLDEDLIRYDGAVLPDTTELGYVHDPDGNGPQFFTEELFITRYFENFSNFHLWFIVHDLVGHYDNGWDETHGDFPPDYGRECGPI